MSSSVTDVNGYLTSIKIEVTTAAQSEGWLISLSTPIQIIYDVSRREIGPNNTITDKTIFNGSTGATTSLYYNLTLNAIVMTNTDLQNLLPSFLILTKNDVINYKITVTSENIKPPMISKTASQTFNAKVKVL